MLRSDINYPTDFGFREKCRIPSDSDADLESVTSLVFKPAQPCSPWDVCFGEFFYFIWRLSKFVQHNSLLTMSDI